jgi:hypothetical protein
MVKTSKNGKYLSSLVYGSSFLNMAAGHMTYQVIYCL